LPEDDLQEDARHAHQDAPLPEKKKSDLRREVEAALAEKGISVERRITVINLDTKETSYFDDYHQALQFMKGRKGRWYLATPGMRRM